MAEDPQDAAYKQTALLSLLSLMLQGMNLVKHHDPGSGMPYVRCRPRKQGIIARNPWLIGVIVAVGTILCTAFMLFLCLNRRTRPAFVQSLFNMRKRLTGAPRSGQVSIVNTDIEGYSGEMDIQPLSAY